MPNELKSIFCRGTVEDMPDSTDNDLIAKYLKGDEDALPALINRHLKTIYNFCYRMLGNSQDAEDVTQETFVKAWRHLKKYRHGENFKTWLFAISRNTAIDLLRKKKRLVFSDFSAKGGSAFGGENEEWSFLDTLADKEPLPDESIIRAADEQILENLLQQLPLHYREVLLLYYHHDITFDEIGIILDKPLNTVKSQHRRGLAALRDLLQDNERK